MRSTPRSRPRSRPFRRRQSFLMIDDDEIASPDWLEQMLSAAEATGADIVGGPVFPHFDDQLKRGLRRHPAFAPAYRTSGPVPVIYGSGNCLIRRAGVRARRRRSTCASISSAAATPISSTVAAASACAFTGSRRPGSARRCRRSRTRLSWLITRGLRIGAINYHVQRKATPTVWLRARLTLKLLAALPYSLVRAARAVLTERERTIAMHPMTVAVGSVLAAIGIEPQPYKASKISTVSQLRHHFRTSNAVVGEVQRQQVMDIVRGARLRRCVSAGLDIAASVRRSRQHADRRGLHRQ